MMFGEEIAADEDRHAAGDLAHRFEQRQAAVDLDGFVGNGGHTGFQKSLGQRPVCGEVQIREENLTRAQQGIFLGKGLLDLHDQVGRFEHGRMGIDKGGAGLCVVVIGIPRPGAGVAFDNDCMTPLDELIGG